MLMSSLLLINLLLVSADDATHNGYCEKNQKSCHVEDADFANRNLIFYDVNPPEGFNLRRDVYMRFAIMLTEAKKRGDKTNWHLVLPPWYDIYHWKSDNRHKPPQPWNKFFDLGSLKSYAPVLELYEVFAKTKKNIEIDTLYILQNFEDAFENGVFEDRWKVSGPCKYEGNYWGYRNITAKEVLCVQFQGTISQLWQLILLHSKDKSVMFAHGEVPLHETYGTKSFWDCRRSMKFNINLIKTAEQYIKDHFNCDTVKCSNYLALHWRRQDFLHLQRSSSIEGTAKQIHNTIKNKSLDINDIFIATDTTIEELEHLETELYSLGYKANFYIPDIDKYSDGEIAVIEQIICSHSAYFIGTHESTFTFRIQEEREILGFDSDTTFNRLCPDNGKCEKPSRWTIVH